MNSTAGPGPTPSVPGLTVAAVARRLGVAPATLRTWDRRYGLGPSAHTAGAHRRYSAADVARLEHMRRLVLVGVPPADAARAARDLDLQSVPLAAVAALPPVPDRRDALAASVRGRPTADGDPEGGHPGAGQPWGRHPGGGHPGGGQVVPIPGGTPAARGLARAAAALDGAACLSIVTETLERRGVIWTWDHLLVPVLVGVGQRWESTGRGVEIEHVLSEAIAAGVGGIATRLGATAVTRSVLLAAAEGEQHSLPLVTLAAALAERRIGTRFLGAQVPWDALGAAMRRTGPAVVLVWSQRPETGQAHCLRHLPDLRPAPVLLVAGPGWPDALPAGASRVTDLTDAVNRIARALGD